MKDHHKDKAHPTPKGGGMPYFNKDHWQKDIPDTEVAGGRYASEMNGCEEYKTMVDKQAKYVKSHRAEH